MRGVFIVIEGPDGAGKTTLARALAGRVRAGGRTVVEVREPGGTPAAELARRGAFAPELETSIVAELFFVLAARADLVEKVIRPALAGGSVVVSDRYDLSTEAYQIGGRGLPAEPVRQSNQLATGGLRPDLTIVLDVPAEVGRARQAAEGKTLDRMEQESLELHQRVHAVFQAASGPAVAHVDGTRPADQVESAAWSILRGVLNGTRER